MKGRAQPPSDPLPNAPRGEIVVPPPPLPVIWSSPFAVTPPKPAAVQPGFWAKENPNLCPSVPFLKRTQISLLGHLGGDKFSLPSLFSAWLSLASSLF